MSVHNNTFLVL